jgi:transcriptional regulator with XRE-family HTH domain
MSEDLYKKIFSKNLNYYMELNEKTQTDIINDLGFNKSAVSTWCNGTRLPRMDKVELLAQYFGINRSDLIEDKNEQVDEHYYLNDEARELAQFMFENPEYKVLFDASRKVKKEDIAFVKEMIDRVRGDDNDTGC